MYRVVLARYTLWIVKDWGGFEGERCCGNIARHMHIQYENDIKLKMAKYDGINK